RQSNRLAAPEAPAVEQLDERAIAEGTWRRTVRSVDQPFGFGRRERPRQPPAASRQIELRCGIVLPEAEQRLVPEERPQRRHSPGERRGGEPLRAKLGEVALEVVRRRRADGSAEPVAEGGEIAAVRVNGPWRPSRGQQGKESVDLGIRVIHHGAGFDRSPSTPSTPTLRVGEPWVPPRPTMGSPTFRSGGVPGR